MMMVEFLKIGDKRGQQRRRRADGAVRSVADRSAVEEDRPFTPEAAQTTQGRSSVDPEPACAGRDFVDSAERGSLAGPAGEIPASFDVLAETARLGGAGRLVEHLADVSERDGRALRRYRRRWIVERTNAWLGNFRRLVVRYDRSLTIYGAFFHIACFMIVLRRVVQ